MGKLIYGSWEPINLQQRIDRLCAEVRELRRQQKQEQEDEQMVNRIMREMRNRRCKEKTPC